MQNSLEKDLEAALTILRDGGLILYPTDTIWGVGCDASNPAAVARIYALKQREDSKSMLSLVGSEKMLSEWVEEIPLSAKEILRTSDRPVTCIYPSPRNLAPNLLAEDGSAGLRVTSETFSSLLCLRLGRPIVSTSANISGHRAPRFYHEVEKAIRDGVDYTVEYRREDTTPASPSRIIKIMPDGNILPIR